MSPPVLADITQDGVEDIIVATFNSTIIAFDGETYKQIWNYSFPNSETFRWELLILNISFVNFILLCCGLESETA